jgi:hypothetical protein
MNRQIISLFLGTALGTAVSAHGPSAAAQGNTQTSAEADKGGAQASSNNSVSGSANAGANSAGLSNGTAMNAELSQSLDTKKCKPGDVVTAKTTAATKSGGEVVIPRGTKLVGHVTESRARAKGESDSELRIMFDKAVLKDGREIALNNVTVQALAAQQTAAGSTLAQNDLSAGGGAVGGASAGGRASGGGGGALGGARSTTGGAVGTVTDTASNVGAAAGGAVNSAANMAGTSKGAVGGLDAAGQLTSNSRGVFGLEGLSLNSAAVSNTQGSVITSAGKNVHLDSGTQMLLVAQGAASAAGSKP